MRTDTQTLIAAMRHLAATIQSDDGVANAAIAEAADRLDEMHAACKSAIQHIETIERMHGHELPEGEMLRAAIKRKG
jgi:hypothetical protein